MKYKIIQSGSKGNAIIYQDKVMVDCGVPYADIEEHLKEVKVILLTHEHKDHFNTSTIMKVAIKHPAIIFVGCDWMIKKLKAIGPMNCREIEISKVWIDGINRISVSPFQLYHDVPNCGWRISVDDKMIFHATDTSTLEGIVAKGYDLYAIEQNYDETIIHQRMEEESEKGLFSHGYGSINSHLSVQQAESFIEQNRKKDSQILKLHQSTSYL